MRPKNHACSCGNAFEFRVELAVHRESTGHAPIHVEEPPAPPPAPKPVVVVDVCERQPEPPAPAPAAPRGKSLARPLVALALVSLLYAFNLVMESTVSGYTEVRNSVTMEWAAR